jgi:broad specificity phosphatase PhoE
MQRAQLTLAPMAARKALTAINLPDLREVDFGEWTGCAWDELKTRFGVDARDWLTQLDTGRVKDAETGDQLLARVAPCLRRILDESAGQSAAVVCHGGIVRALLALLLQIPLPKTACFRVEYGSITTVHIQPDKVHRVEIEHLNVRPLEGAGAVRDL